MEVRTEKADPQNFSLSTESMKTLLSVLIRVSHYSSFHDRYSMFSDWKGTNIFNSQSPSGKCRSIHSSLLNYLMGTLRFEVSKSHLLIFLH